MRLHAATVAPERQDCPCRPYLPGFRTIIESDTFPKGLDENVVKAISLKKREPQWMLDFRLKAYRRWLTMAEPAWSDNRQAASWGLCCTHCAQGLPQDLKLRVKLHCARWRSRPAASGSSGAAATRDALLLQVCVLTAPAGWQVSGHRLPGPELLLCAQGEGAEGQPGRGVLVLVLMRAWTRPCTRSSAGCWRPCHACKICRLAKPARLLRHKPQASSQLTLQLRSRRWTLSC